ncbi:MAG: zinc ribbon domain-containing protein [Verrucomicrobiota bacterium]
MATYLYETTDPSKPPRQFEFQQSMKEAPLSHDPQTGEPVRRVISGGYGFVSKGGAPKAAGGGGGGSCGSGCGCHN